MCILHALPLSPIILSMIFTSMSDDYTSNPCRQKGDSCITNLANNGVDGK